MSTVEGFISFKLSDRGRKRLLLAGRGSAQEHTFVGEVTEADVDIFEVSPDGASLIADVSLVPDVPPQSDKYQVIGIAGKGCEISWHTVPTWADLMDLARWVRNWHAEQEREEFDAQLADDKRRAEVAAQFLNNTSARAENVPKKGGGPVTINGYVFHDAEVVEEANKRKQKDADDKRAAQWKVLSKWIKENGSYNQQQRLAAGFLPFMEAYEAMENYVFAALDGFPLHERFKTSEVCKCIEYEVSKNHCKPRFESKDATELGPEEWECYEQIRAKLPGAKHQFRVHEAECTIEPTQRRYGVIVKVNVDSLGFKREYALKAVNS
jgi:hypothetical protein